MRTCLKYLISTLLSVPICADAGEFVGLQNGIAFRLVPQVVLRTSGIVTQQWDWSCASASMATLVDEKFAISAPEQALFDTVVAPLAGDPAALREIEKRGMTVAHLIQMTAALGLHGQGVVRSLAGLLEAEPLPVIARITEPHPDEPDRVFQHWVVISGIAGNRVLMRDPVRGNRRMPLYAFTAAWLGSAGKGVLFRVEKDPDRFGRLTANSIPTVRPAMSTADQAVANETFTK